MDIVEIIVIGTAIMLILGVLVVILVMAQQKQVIQHKLTLRDKDLDLQQERLVAVLQGQEQERKRIAEDLHDEVGAQLSVLKLNLGSLQQQAKNGHNDGERLKEIRDFADTIIQELRFISQRLHPQSLDNLGLANALDSFCSLMNKNRKTKIQFQCPENTQPVDRTVALNIYRVVQELINNILKHAQASQVIIHYQTCSTQLLIEITDDGNGLLLTSLEAARQQPGSLGLKNIESRLTIINGNINFVPGTAGGTIARISVSDYNPGL
ncbi:Histidine kinase [Chitinophaga costaii]|uniref:histidine kinase n=1 Tax=Chitinophaga costaii TaxID=1335309 RepID=A0A1C4FD04_9BACT|nr:histidine kinase [Chitinophaga costaii]PUZ20670.1 hypothetical protein DCM91_18055 [Chitinophaga costaii]SCC53868.1 Histidine kinase [Chitinophaga costaii]